MKTRLYNLVNRFESAVRSHANRGGGLPADIPVIDANYEHAKEQLLEALESQKTVRMLRVLEYIGSPKTIEHQIEQRGVKGVMRQSFQGDAYVIREAIIGDTREFIKREEALDGKP